ncbi:extensin family protein [Bosea sp. 124]|uniref:extensin-like domain-containing protein n=1 Tax=Bosea sp. 124 TaxID=2135642 RepID=UPI0015E7512B|nr:extensin family protein [Bosea sp. 124]
MIAAALLALHLCAAADAQSRGRGRSDNEVATPLIMTPLPPRRPADLTASKAKPAKTPPAPTAPDGPMGPPACFATFFKRGGIALPVAPESGDGACEITDPVTFRAISMPGGAKVELDSAITVTCAFAVELLDWVRDDLPGIISRENGTLSRLIGVGGHACRPRNGVPGAQISEHATGNALDLGALRLADGRTLTLVGTDAATRTLREALKTSSCARFRTVLGPGSDDSHKDHLHLDMRQRPRDYKICQWHVD